MSLPGRGCVQIVVEVVATREKIEQIRISKASPLYILKMRLRKHTGVPYPEQILVHKGIVMKDQRTIRSYGVETEDTVLLVRRGPSVLSTVLSNSKLLPPSYAMETNYQPIPSIQAAPGPWAQSLDRRTPNAWAIIRSIPMLSQAVERDHEVGKMMQNGIILRCVLSYLLYLEIYGGETISDVDDPISVLELRIGEYKSKCSIYDDDDYQQEPYTVRKYRQGAYNNLLEILLSDATLLEYYNKTGGSINGAITAVLGQDDEPPHKPFERLLLALPDDDGYNSSSSSSSDGGSDDDISLEEKQYEEMLSGGLKRMKELKFVNLRENIRALLKSGTDVERAIEMIAVAE